MELRTLGDGHAVSLSFCNMLFPSARWAGARSDLTNVAEGLCREGRVVAEAQAENEQEKRVKYADKVRQGWKGTWNLGEVPAGSAFSLPQA